ncbi:universal stress protein [Undibacterium fentianense]|uniref:Universal stress protein n=1 Tax=Undibacterium fentianense TaxID=2828728 RepID=A0A941E024_9BURK|nr:universal stress protein [Undibacterium fentianense]MBR7798846.1 universal stress protein [Undibacterium fentianense]
MTYKTLLVHVDESKSSTKRTELALQIANKFDSHLTGVALTGISRYIFESTELGAGDPNIMFHLSALRERADNAVKHFKRICLEQNYERSESLIANDEANGGLGLRARYADLIIIGQTNQNEPSPSVMSDFPEFMIVNSGRPVLIVPHTGETKDITGPCAVAWDGSRESARAITDAIPLLKLSELVHLILINPEPKEGTHGEEPGADLALYLARHGIKIEVVQRLSKSDTGGTLLQICQELQVNWLVMGGYGHSRFREMIMGGTTRTILEKTHIPVLMSH